MKDVEKNESEEHGYRVENILVGFVAWDATCETLRIFGQTEYNSNLYDRLVETRRMSAVRDAAYSDQ